MANFFAAPTPGIISSGARAPRNQPSPVSISRPDPQSFPDTADVISNVPYTAPSAIPAGGQRSVSPKMLNLFYKKQPQFL